MTRASPKPRHGPAQAPCSADPRPAALTVSGLPPTHVQQQRLRALPTCGYFAYKRQSQHGTPGLSRLPRSLCCLITEDAHGHAISRLADVEPGAQHAKKSVVCTSNSRQTSTSQVRPGKETNGQSQVSVSSDLFNTLRENPPSHCYTQPRYRCTHPYGELSRRYQGAQQHLTSGRQQADWETKPTGQKTCDWNTAKGTLPATLPSQY